MSESKKYQIKYSGDGTPSTKVKSSYDKLLKELANDFEIDIEIVICHGKYDYIPAELDFEKFYIFAQLVPDIMESKNKKISKLQLGDKELEVTGGQSDSLVIKGNIPKDVTVITDSNDQQVAIVYDASLYILNDFIHCHSKPELDSSIEVFKYIINEATKTPELITALKSGAEEKGRRSLEMALKKQFKERLKKEKIQLDSSEKLIDNYTQEITKASRKIISTQSIIKAIHNNLEDIPISLEKKWNSTKRLEETLIFESVSFQRNSVKAVTTPIFITENKAIHQLGKFEIILEFNGNIRIMSLWPDRGPGQQHPHVSADGRPCWGNLSGELPKRIAESEFDVAFVEIHTFLCHYSLEGGPYADISNWPVATAEQLEMLKAEKVKS